MPTGVYPHKPHQLFQKGHTTWIGRKLTEEHKAKLRKPKGSQSHFKGRTYDEVYGALAVEQRLKRKLSRILFHDKIGRTTYFQRPKHHLWRHREFRDSVFKRDNHTCQLCGQRGGALQADHYPESFASIVRRLGLKTMEQAIACDALWDPNNGRTLCVKCHRKTPTFARNLVNKNANETMPAEDTPVEEKLLRNVQASKTRVGNEANGA